jgi:hypothetical protein
MTEFAFIKNLAIFEWRGFFIAINVLLTINKAMYIILTRESF